MKSSSRDIKIRTLRGNIKHYRSKRNFSLLGGVGCSTYLYGVWYDRMRRETPLVFTRRHAPFTMSCIIIITNAMAFCGAVHWFNETVHNLVDLKFAKKRLEDFRYNENDNLND